MSGGAGAAARVVGTQCRCRVGKCPMQTVIRIWLLSLTASVGDSVLSPRPASCTTLCTSRVRNSRMRSHVRPQLSYPLAFGPGKLPKIADVLDQQPGIEGCDFCWPIPAAGLTCHSASSPYMFVHPSGSNMRVSVAPHPRASWEGNLALFEPGCACSPTTACYLATSVQITRPSDPCGR